MGGKVNHSPNFPQRPKNPTCKSFSRLFQNLHNRNIVVQPWGAQENRPLYARSFLPQFS